MKNLTAISVLLGLLAIQAIASPRQIFLLNEVVDTREALQAHEDYAHQSRVRSLAPETKHQYFLHIGRTLEPLEKYELEEYLGLKLTAYVPHHTYLIVVDQALALRAASAPYVKWVGDFAPKYKVGPGARQASKILVTLSATQRSADEIQSLISEWRSALDIKEIKAIAANKIQVTLNSASDAENTVAWIAERSETQFIEASVTYEPHNQYASKVIQSNSNPKMVNPVYYVPITGNGSIVGLADSGINTANTYFSGSGKVTYISTYGDNVDASGHGTSVAGTIAGRRADVNDLSNGIAYGAKLYFVDIEKDGVFSPPATLSSMFGPAQTAGVKVFALPFGAEGSSYGADAQDIDEFTFANPEFLPICSVGNYNSTSLSTLAYSKNCLVVGSHLNSNAGMVHSSTNTRYTAYPNLYDSSVLSTFSSVGPTTDGRIKPDLCSIGEGLVTASNVDATSTRTVSGTSYAVGSAAAAAVFIQQLYEQGFLEPGLYTSATVKATLINSGVPLSIVDTNGKGHYVNIENIPSQFQGFGRIQLDGIFANLTAGEPVAGVIALQGSVPQVGVFPTDTYCFTVPEGASMKATLVWTDPAGQLMNGFALVNDLDLVVTNAMGSQYRTSTAPNGEFDQYNNVEQVDLANLPGGQYTVHVHGRNVPVGPQAYALVISGTIGVFFDSVGCAASACPSDCSGYGTCNQGANGAVCSCTQQRTGVDCSLTPCAGGCSGNGACDFDTSTCICAAGWAAPNCAGRIPTGNTTSSEVPPVIQTKSGVSTGVLAGAVVAAFFIGAIISVFLGGCLAVKYLEYRRDKAQKDRATKEEEMR